MISFSPCAGMLRLQEPTINTYAYVEKTKKNKGPAQALVECFLALQLVYDPGGSRTRDLRIKSPLLYQLSYRVDLELRPTISK